MTLKDLYDMRLVNDNTQITMLRMRPEFAPSAFEKRIGNWFNDGIISWMTVEIEAFDWKNDNSLTIRIAKEAANDITRISPAV